jgi:biopolymer transport protein ExbD
MFKPTIRGKTSINIIPMIDVIFFLLVFFMLFTTFRTSPYGIELNLPKAVTVNEQNNNNMILSINENAQIYYQGKAYTLNEIHDIATKKYKNNKNLVVIINGDKEIKYKHIVSLMDELRQIGIYKLALAAEKKE